MNPRHFSLICGIFYLVIGILAFVPNLVLAPSAFDPLLALDQNYGRFLGAIPVNVISNLVHILIGIAGVAAVSSRFMDLPASINYARGVAVVAGILTVMGLFNGADITWGYMPLFGGAVWLHALTAVVAAYYGFRLTAEIPLDRGPEPSARESLRRGSL